MKAARHSNRQIVPSPNRQSPRSVFQSLRPVRIAPREPARTARSPRGRNLRPDVPSSRSRAHVQSSILSVQVNRVAVLLMIITDQLLFWSPLPVFPEVSQSEK